LVDELVFVDEVWEVWLVDELGAAKLGFAAAACAWLAAGFAAWVEALLEVWLAGGCLPLAAALG
jgi:hypothetical protein